MSRTISLQRIVKTLQELAKTKVTLPRYSRDVEKGFADEKASRDTAKPDDGKAIEETSTGGVAAKSPLQHLATGLRAVWTVVLTVTLAILGFLYIVVLILGCILLFVPLLAFEVGTYSFAGFAGLTLGQAILSGARPSDAAYDVGLRSTMQVGAVGGAVLGIPCTALTALLIVASDGEDPWSGVGVIFQFALSAAFGAAVGPLGGAVLKHHYEPSEVLDATHAARAGALGLFILGVFCMLQYRWKVVIPRE